MRKALLAEQYEFQKYGRGGDGVASAEYGKKVVESGVDFADGDDRSVASQYLTLVVMRCHFDLCMCTRVSPFVQFRGTFGRVQHECAECVC